MKGQTEVLKILFNLDKEKKIYEIIEKSSKNKEIKSTVYLAIVSDNIECAIWLIDSGIAFKEGEADEIMYKILTDNLTM